MPVNSLESFIDRGLPTEADRAWFRINAQMVDIRGTRTSDREATGHGAILPALEDEELMLVDMNIPDSRATHALVTFDNNMRNPRPIIDMMTLSDDDVFHHGEDERGIQFSSSQVEDFMKTLSRVEMGTLEIDDLRCSICREEYGKQRADITEPASGSDSRLPDEEAPESPLELPCRHVFGEWCIKTWLLGQPASCPICRFLFKPAE